MKIWRNLFWKEWHEQKWKLLALTAIALSVCVALLFQDLGNVAFSLVFTSMAYAMLAPILMGMGVCAGEHATGVIQFVRAQPVSMRRMASVRWIAGACVMLIPLICVTAICWIVMCSVDQVGQKSVRTSAFLQLDSTWRESSALFVLSLAGKAGCLNLYAWIAAVAVNQRTEFRAGLVGLLVIVAMIFAGIGGMSAWDNHLPSISVPSLFFLMSSPLVSLGIVDFIWHSLQGLVFVAVVWQLLLTMCLMQVMVFRYGREERGFSGDFFTRAKTKMTESIQLGKPLSSQWRALLWLQIRQSLPVCVVGLCLVSTIVLTSGGFAPDSFDSMYPIIGCVLALLIGVGTFVSELQPELHTFWRSRPISPSSWFWFKFIGGAIAMIGLFDVPCILLIWSGFVQSSSPGFASLFPLLLHLLCYSIAVFMACILRHTTYATVFAVGALIVLILVPELPKSVLPRFLSFLTMWNDAAPVSRRLFSVDPRSGYPVLWQTGVSAVMFLLPAIGLVCAIVIPTTIAAAYLIKRDISVGS